MIVGIPCGRWHAVTCWAICVAAAVAGEPSEPDAILIGQRWREHSYGISLRPPLDSRMVSQTADDALVRFYGKNGYLIRLYIKKSTGDLTVSELMSEAVTQFGGVYPSARILVQKQTHQANRPAALIYFGIPDRTRGPWVLGQAYVQLTGRAFAMLQFEVDRDHFTDSQAVFEAVFGSIEVQDPEELDHQRRSQIAAGHAWLASLDVQQLRRSILPDQWFRILDPTGADAGYIRVQQKPDRQMDQPGIQVKIRSRIMIGPTAYDSISHFFAADNGQQEFWSVRTTVRPNHENRQDVARHPSWAETGVRSKDKITVSFERPSGIQKYHWTRPPEGYLSQVQLHMLEQVLGRDQVQTMGFYAYHPNAQKLTYRTTRVEAAPDGSYTIFTRPSPEQEEQSSHYSAQGKLIERRLPGGQTVRPATGHELARQWKVQ